MKAMNWIFATLLLGICANTVFAAEFGDNDRARAGNMLRGVEKAIEKNYFDKNYKGVDLAAKADIAKARIEKSASIGDAFTAIAWFVGELDDSHVHFLPPWQTVAVDYGWGMSMVGDTCYVTKVKPDSDAAKQNVKPGDIVKAVNGLPPTRATLPNIRYLFGVLRLQPGLHVELVTPEGAARELDLAAATRELPQKVVSSISDQEWNFSRAWREDAKKMQLSTVEASKQVLLVRMPTFMVEESAVKEFIKRARKYESLILDLRGDGGGSIDVLKTLLGGLAAHDIAIGAMKERERNTELVAKGFGGEAFSGRIFVLVDSESASSSELAARVVQLTKRGVVVGDRSAGAVMIAKNFQLVVSHGLNSIYYGLEVTIADIVMSDGGRLEKQGVIPDQVVLPTAADMAAGRDPALAQALALAGISLDPTAAAALLAKAQ